MAAGSTQRLCLRFLEASSSAAGGMHLHPLAPLSADSCSRCCCLLPSLLESPKAQSSLRGVTAAWQKQAKCSQQKIQFIKINMV